MQQEYERAAQFSPAVLAASTGKAVIDGYWLDDDSFFFVPESRDLSDGGTPIPYILNAARMTWKPVLEAAELLSLLSRGVGRPVLRSELVDASFDMPNRNRLVIRFDGQQFSYDLGRKSLVHDGAAAQFPALYSPDGRFGCFIRGNDLWLLDCRTQAQRPLTTDGLENWSYGQESETALSAVSYRRNPSPRGVWSPDSRWFLTHRIDERAVPRVGLVQNAPAGYKPPITHQFRFTMPGDPAPLGIYVAIDVEDGRVIAFDQFPTEMKGYSPLGFYAMKSWFSDDAAWVVRTDRYHKVLELLRLDLVTGDGKIVRSEQAADGYIEAHQFYSGTPNIRNLPGKDEIIWYSERDGWAHLYLYELSTGRLKRQLTAGAWAVRDIVHVDHKARRVFFTACGRDPQADPVRRTLCAVSLDGGEIEILHAHAGDLYVPKTQAAGGSQDRWRKPSYAPPGVSPGARWAVCREMNAADGDRTRIVDLENGTSAVIVAAAPTHGDIRAREFTATAADGKTILHGVMYLPPDFDAAKRYPLIDNIYPGPQIPWRPQAYDSVNAGQSKALAALGFVTVMFDTRGMPYRSRAVHQASYPNLLEPQLADHRAVVEQLVERFAFIDGSRIGMFGMSGGGGAAARALFDYGETFKVGVAVCGNHNPDIGSASFSDRYRGRPGDKERIGSNLDAAHKLTGKLLLMTGDMDENVQPAHTLQLADALIRANRDFDLLIVPNAGHDVLMTSGYAQRRMWDYFVEHLLGATPAKTFNLQFTERQANDYRRAWAREVFQ